MNFANKYRPKSFKTFMGYEAEVERVKSLLEKDDMPLTWLITGDKGNGKTTLARLMARKIMGVSIKDDIAAHGDYEELNLGADNSIDKMRELLATIRFKPKLGNYKVVVLDECHVLRKGSASALLKILEEPPKHVVFIMATNEPQGVLPTIKDRAKLVQLGGLNKQALLKVINRVVEAEDLEKKIPDKICERIAENFQYETRSALNVLEDLSVLNTKDLSEDIINAQIEKHLKFELSQASDILSSLYKGDFSTACNLGQKVDDISYMANGLLMINDFLIKKMTGVTVFQFFPGLLLLKSIKASPPELITVLQVQEILFLLKREITMYNMLDPKQVSLVYFVKIALAIKEKIK